MIKDLKPNTNISMKVKIGKILDEKEIDNKEGKKVKVMLMELEDEEGEIIECDFYGLENCKRIDDNLGKWVMLNKFWVKSYKDEQTNSEVLKLSSAKFGYIRPIGGLY